MNVYRTHLTWLLLILIGITPSCAKKQSCVQPPQKACDQTVKPVEKPQPVLKTEPVLPEVKGENPIFATTAPVPEQETPILRDKVNKESPVEQANRLLDQKELPLERPTIELPEQEELIEFYFENADLEQLVKQIEDIYGVTFITDDTVTPGAPGALTRPIKGNKISFKTEKPLTRKEAWNLFNTFLSIAGLAIVPEPSSRVLRITATENARRMPLPAFIGVPFETLPDSDEMVRFVYFYDNISTDTLRSLIGDENKPGLRSPSSAVVILQELRALVITDKAYNIKSLMQIIKELDKANAPQAMTVLKLKRADAMDVAKLYKQLNPEEDRQSVTARLFPGRRTPTGQYFPDGTKIFAEPRTNSLIILGSADGIRKIEDFITRFIDVELTQPYSPIHVIKMRYADARTIANIMNSVTTLGQTGPQAAYGSVRDGDKFFKPMTFVPEPEGNQLIVRADYEDFLKVKDIVAMLDAPQRQVAVEVLILLVDLVNSKELGAQIRTRVPGVEGLTGYNVDFQTSGLRAGGVANRIVENTFGPGANRLLGNLLSLVNFAPAGNTVISLGDNLNVWAILQLLQTVSNTQVVSNPFVVATNKTSATVTLGEVRRLITSQIISNATANTFGDESAKLEINVTPQINSDGMIVLDLGIELSNFITAADPVNAARITRKINTTTISANREVIALGGLIQNTVTNNVSKVPILGDIPVLGWLFKNKRRAERKQDLLILISTTIIEPFDQGSVKQFTQKHINAYELTTDDMRDVSQKRDPVDLLFFQPSRAGTERAADDFIFQRKNNNCPVDPAPPLPPLGPQGPINLAQQKSEEVKPTEPTVIAAQRTRPLAQTGSKKSLVELFYEDKIEGATT